MEILNFILIAYGMTFMIVHGKIFEDIRPKKDYSKKWNTLFHCPLCMGFWCSLFLFCINDYTELFTFDYNIANLLILSSLSSGTSYVLDKMISDDGIQVGRNK